MMLRDVRGRDVSRVWKALGQRPRASVFAEMVSVVASAKFRPSYFNALDWENSFKCCGLLYILTQKLMISKPYTR